MDNDLTDKQGWVEWTGGICPVDVDAMIVTKLRGGWVSDGPAKAGLHRWDHGRTPDSPLHANDIVAYRVVNAGPTPGPWVAGEADEFGDHNITRAGEVLAIAAVVSNMRAPGEVEANARLIAAAPELLASVIELLEPLERASAALAEQGKFLNDAGESAFDRARAAIAKATGATS